MINLGLKPVWLKPIWPIWRWPKSRLWLILGIGSICVAVVVLAHDRHVQSEQARIEAALLAKLMASDPHPTESPVPIDALDLAPTQSMLGAVSAEWINQADRQGIRVIHWVVTAPVNDGVQTARSLNKMMLQVHVKGTYAAIKFWLSQNLSTQPWMAIERVEWRSADAGSGMLEAQMTWSFHARE